MNKGRELEALVYCSRLPVCQAGTAGTTWLGGVRVGVGRFGGGGVWVGSFLGEGGGGGRGGGREGTLV